MRKLVLILVVSLVLLLAILVALAKRTSLPQDVATTDHGAGRPESASPSARSGAPPAQAQADLSSGDAAHPSRSEGGQPRLGEPDNPAGDRRASPSPVAWSAPSADDRRWPSEDAYFTDKYRDRKADARLQAAYDLSDILDAHHGGTEDPAHALTEEQAVALAHEIEWLKLHPNP